MIMQWVIKIGGSLYSSKFLIECLEVIQRYAEINIIIVPGGGPFADLVRVADQQFKLDQEHAHNMAVLGMQQFANLIASLKPEFELASTKEEIKKSWQQSRVSIWEPYYLVKNYCGLARNWAVTSDSLAAWLAHYLSIENVIYIKSNETVISEETLDSLVESGCIDLDLPLLVKQYGIYVRFLHKSQSANLESMLKSK